MGRFCLNCGHRIGSPVAPADLISPPPAPEPDPEPDPEPVVDSAEPPAPVGEHTRVRRTAPPPQDHHRWDPEVELLPYEDGSYDDRSDVPVQGRAWIGWVVGAALLVGLVVLLLRVLAVDGEDDVEATDPGSSQATEPADDEDSSDSPDTEPTESPETSDAPEVVGTPTNVTGAATFAVPATAPPTTDFDGQLVAYDATQMQDRRPATAWRMPGDGTGSVITITLAEPTVVSRVGMVNGYAKRLSDVDWYPNNRRILSAEWAFEDGSTVAQTLAERPGMQLTDVTPVLTGTITLTITAVTPPGPGSLGRDYTAISELSVLGQRAA